MLPKSYYIYEFIVFKYGSSHYHSGVPIRHPSDLSRRSLGKEWNAGIQDCLERI